MTTKWPWFISFLPSLHKMWSVCKENERQMFQALSASDNLQHVSRYASASWPNASLTVSEFHEETNLQPDMFYSSDTHQRDSNWCVGWRLSRNTRCSLFDSVLLLQILTRALNLNQSAVKNSPKQTHCCLLVVKNRSDQHFSAARRQNPICLPVSWLWASPASFTSTHQSSADLPLL